MSWSIPQVAQLLKLAEAGELSAEELERAAQAGRLSPTREAWLLAADRLFAFAGAVLLTAAVVFFLAWNWPDMHRFAKVALALAALAAAVGAALVSPVASTVYRAALLGACVATGALLALIGQTYQTGADVWELFAAWAVLMLPLVLLSRSSASWALWLLVANLALARSIWQRAAWVTVLGEHVGPAGLLLLAGLNLALLLVFEFSDRWLLAMPRRHIHRLAALGMFMPLATGAMIGWWQSEYGIVTAAFLLTAAACVYAYWRLRRDLPILATALFSAILVLTGGLIRLLPESDWGFFLYNFVAVFVLAASAVAGQWILRLYREGGLR